MYETAHWSVVPTSETVTNVLPSHDVIEHQNNFICPCHPTIWHDIRQGTVYWVITHQSFDEFLEEDQLEPYKGL